MNPIIKEHLISGLQTFATIFLISIATSLTSSDVPISFTSAFWVPLLISGVRAAIKELLARYAPVSLGGRK